MEAAFLSDVKSCVTMVAIVVGCGTASLAPMGIPTTTLVGSNNMQLVGSNQQHIQVSV